MAIKRLLGILLLLCLPVVASSAVDTSLMTGPNPRYLYINHSGTANDTAILITGMHTWTDFQDFDGTNTNQQPDSFDIDGYLATYFGYGTPTSLEFWNWEEAAFDNEHGTDTTNYYPLPYARSGTPGANDGGNKFDLDAWNTAYFARLYNYVQKARTAGATIVLFRAGNDWSTTDKGFGTQVGWTGHPYNGDNNINSVDGDDNSNGECEECHSDTTLAVYDRYLAFYKKVIDTLDGAIVLHLVNETEGDGIPWMYKMARDLQAYMPTVGKYFPILISTPYPYTGTQDSLLVYGTHEVVSCNTGGFGSLASPTAHTGDKVWYADTDHMGGITGTVEWVMKAVCQGHNPAWMDTWNDEYGITNGGDADSTDIRYAMGWCGENVNRMPLENCKPSGGLSSDSYCLADTVDYDHYFVYTTDGGFTLDMSNGGTPPTGYTMYVDWYDFKTQTEYRKRDTITSFTSSEAFTAPAANSVALFYTEQTTAGANIVYVKEGASGSDDGSSWTNAYSAMSSLTSSTVAAYDTVLINGNFITTDSLPKQKGVVWMGGNGTDNSYSEGGAKIMSGDTVTTSWTSDGGGVYHATIPASISSVGGVCVGDTALLFPGGGTTPAEGEWGTSGGNVYVNLDGGADPTSYQIIVINETIAFQWYEDASSDGDSITIKGIDWYYWFNVIRMYQTADVDHIRVEDCNFLGMSYSGTGANTSAIIILDAGLVDPTDTAHVPSDFIIRDCTFSLSIEGNGDHGNGIELYAAKQVKIDSCYFYGGFGGAGIMLKGNLAEAGPHADIWIVNNIFDVSDNFVLAAHASGTNAAARVWRDHFYKVYFIGNLVRSVSTGARWLGGPNGPYSSSSRIMFNTFYQCGSAFGSTYDGIDAEMSGWNNWVKFNIIYDCSYSGSVRREDITGFLVSGASCGTWGMCSGSDPHLAIDSNQMYAGTIQYDIRYPSATWTFTQWQDSAGWGTYSWPSVDPQFADTSSFTRAGFTPSNAKTVTTVELTDPWSTTYTFTQAGAVQSVGDPPPTASKVTVAAGGTGPVTVGKSGTGKVTATK